MNNSNILYESGFSLDLTLINQPKALDVLKIINMTLSLGVEILEGSIDNKILWEKHIYSKYSHTTDSQHSQEGEKSQNILSQILINEKEPNKDGSQVEVTLAHIIHSQLVEYFQNEQVSLAWLQLEFKDLNLKIKIIDNKILKSKKVTLSSVHFHLNENLSESENEALFKKCSKSHGHEYEIEVVVDGKISNKEFENLLNEHVVNRYNHKNLNDYVSNTTGEVLSNYFFTELQSVWPTSSKIINVKLKETLKNKFYYSK